MTEAAKISGPERFVDKKKPTEDVVEVVNDSLGTVDLADSSGTDCDKQVEADKAGRAMDKIHPAEK